MADIRNMENFIASKWSYRHFDEVFSPTRISFGDLDGVVERNGKFLVIETKGEGIPVPRGQAIMFDRLVEKGDFTVVVLWGNPPCEVKQWCLWPLQIEDANKDIVRSFIDEWWREANQNMSGRCVVVDAGIPVTPDPNRA